MVTAPIGEVEVGQDERKIPPYVGIFPSFDLDARAWAGFHQAMITAAQKIEQPTFRPEAVREDLYAVHEVVRGVVKKWGDFEQKGIGAQWTPRLTGRVTEQQLVVPELVVIRHIDIGRSIVQGIYRWQEQEAYDKATA